MSMSPEVMVQKNLAALDKAARALDRGSPGTAELVDGFFSLAKQVEANLASRQATAVAVTADTILDYGAVRGLVEGLGGSVPLAVGIYEAPQAVGVRSSLPGLFFGRPTVVVDPLTLAPASPDTQELVRQVPRPQKAETVQKAAVRQEMEDKIVQARRWEIGQAMIKARPNLNGGVIVGQLADYGRVEVAETFPYTMTDPKVVIVKEGVLDDERRELVNSIFMSAAATGVTAVTSRIVAQIVTNDPFFLNHHTRGLEVLLHDTDAVKAAKMAYETALMAADVAIYMSLTTADHRRRLTLGEILFMVKGVNEMFVETPVNLTSRQVGDIMRTISWRKLQGRFKGQFGI